jgi:hypothetical protein
MRFPQAKARRSMRIQQTGPLWMLVAALVGELIAAPGRAQSLTALQQRLQPCFRDGIGCNTIWGPSHQLKQRAEAANQLRCYSALLALEAMVTLAELGQRDPGRQAEALQESSRECR